NNEGSIYQTTDGRWRAAITLDDRGRKYLTGRTREEIVAKLRKSQQRVDQGLGVDTERLTVGAWLDHWFTNGVTPPSAPTPPQRSTRSAFACTSSRTSARCNSAS